MKSKRRIIGRLALLALALTINSQLSTVHAQGTAFSYQGRLNTNGSPATGLYDFSFALYDALSGGTQQGATVTTSAVGVTNGLFTVTLDFGNQFTGSALWLDISVRTNGAGSFTELAPRQALTPAPYAVYAENANAAGLSGTVALAQLPSAVVTNNESGVVLNGLSVTATNVIAPVTVPPNVPAAAIGSVGTDGQPSLRRGGGAVCLCGEF